MASSVCKSTYALQAFNVLKEEWLWYEKVIGTNFKLETHHEIWMVFLNVIMVTLRLIYIGATS